MAKQNIIQQSKFNSKAAIISLVLGIVSLIPAILVEVLSRLPPDMGLIGILISVLYYVLIAPSLALGGFVAGIFGLKSPKRNFAIAGIIFCVIGLLVPLYYFLF